MDGAREAALPASLARHRIRHRDVADVVDGEVRFSWTQGPWFLGMTAAWLVGGALTISAGAVALYLTSTALVLLLGHSLGSHRKLIHDSFQCPRWLEYLLVYLGVQVGLAGPLGLMRQHELRDYAQRLPVCHDFLRHGKSFWLDAWWQLACELRLRHEPRLVIEPRIANARFHRFLERTWMLQHLPWAVLFWSWGGWGFVFWGVCGRVATGVFGHWIIGYFAHNHGEMHHVVDGAAVQGHNVRWTSLLTMGESWHNNHHAFPGSARLGLRADEWDPGWWVLCGLRRIGLVWSIRLPADLAPRPELRALPPRRKKPCRFCPTRFARGLG
jgi:stearoyl-CoA desaturase (delta-9 desaturase)